MYIVDSTLTDDQINPIIAKYSALVADQGGEVQAHAKWDKRRLAYEIKGRREGIYILMYFTGESAVEKELGRVFRISDEVIRHIILRVEPERIDTSYVERAQASAKASEETAVEEPSEAAVETTAEEAQAVEETPSAEEPAAAEESGAQEPKED
jgi:small subunit ribosomal protein S6